MTMTKRKISVSLDTDLVEELEGADATLSAQINDAVRSELERQRQHRLLGQLLDELEDETGPADERLVAKYEELLR